ncbi:hypothetical protein CAPTEDRAFT_190429 [Capitella teleta]|uniref:Tetraspanin n=1 Tax=Capitella teleta TaxID=283909 RepID=R7T323_CAPTE|nr:hypothetical protein CAPTEDRAFT_190429 [Capitella teleta]|eukprot:ELT86997.1 hypothetical protein CAPTEDRAFT_190429 [Capitella teleta]
MFANEIGCLPDHNATALIIMHLKRDCLLNRVSKNVLLGADCTKNNLTSGSSQICLGLTNLLEPVPQSRVQSWFSFAARAQILQKGRSTKAIMGCGTGFLKCILVLINIVFAIIGLLFLGVGIYFEYFANDTLNSQFASVISRIPGLSSLANVADASTTASSSLNIDFANLLNPVTLALIVIGAVLAGIAIIGCIGACCNSRCFIITHCILMAIILVGQIVLVGLFFGGVLKPYIETFLQRAIDDDYVSIDDTSLYSLAFNFIMVEGCWTASSQRLDTYKTIAIGVLAGVLVVQFIILLFGICIARSFGKDSEEV